MGHGQQTGFVHERRGRGGDPETRGHERKTEDDQEHNWQVYKRVTCWGRGANVQEKDGMGGEPQVLKQDPEHSALVSIPDLSSAPSGSGRHSVIWL